AARRVQQPSHASFARRRHFIPFRMKIIPFAYNTAPQAWRRMPDRLDQIRIEGHDGDRTRIAGENIYCTLRKPRIAIKATFELQYQRNPPRNDITQFPYSKDPP